MKRIVLVSIVAATALFAGFVASLVRLAGRPYVDDSFIRTN